jgi:phenylacetaldehyde dehydrogenase
MILGMAMDTTDHSARVAEILGSTEHMLIGGEWVPSSSGATLDVIDPGSGRRLGVAPSATKEDVAAAVGAAQAALVSWRSVAPLERASLLWRLSDLIEGNVEELAFLETLDTGKPLSHTRDYDIPSAVAQFRYMSGLAVRLDGHLSPLVTMPAEAYHNYTRREPVGVVAAIVPWNFPLAGAAWKVAPALACGNTVILKPSEETPLTALKLGRLAEEAGFPPGVLNIVPGSGDIAGAALVRDPRVNKISFTGSTATGQEIVKAAADNLTRVALELGGKSPHVIFADADLDAAIEGAAAGIYWDSGEVCSAGSRIYVEAPLLDQVIAGLEQQARAMPIGHGLDPRTEIGPLISKRHLERVASYVDNGRAEGAVVAFGGEPLDRDGFFYSPTVLTQTTPDMKVTKEEIFGPVVNVVPFGDVDEAVGVANDTMYGLAAGVWTRDIAKAHAFAASVHAGIVWVNCFGVDDPAMPWGGFKKSGWGRENGHEVVAEYTETKAVCMYVGG